MNTTTASRSIALLVLVAASAFPPVLIAGPESGNPAYTLFMGVDIALEVGKSFYRVDGVDGSYFKINVDGKEEMVSTRNGTARMRIDNSLKLAGTPISLEDVKAERDYTPANDPRLKFSKVAGAASGASAAADLSTFQNRMAQENLAGVMGNPNSTPSQIAAAQAGAAAAANSEYQAYYSINSDFNSPGYQAEQMELELAKKNFDAIAISLSVSSPVPLDDPYIIVIAQIHERDAKKGVLRNWIYAQKLDPIGAKERRIYIKQGGLPVGYELVDCQVRLYNHGHELPTNLSPKRVDLTRGDAQKYIVIEYLAAHKDESLPAVAVFGEAPADLKERLAEGRFTQPYYVKVDADGTATGTYTDRDCTRKVDDPYVEAFVAKVLFAPALEKGSPVAGVARLLLGASLK